MMYMPLLELGLEQDKTKSIQTFFSNFSLNGEGIADVTV